MPSPTGGARTTTEGRTEAATWRSINDRLWSWASILEDSTREQAERTARMPFVFPHVALMPDAHLGRGATVGSVIPTLGALMPAAVGVDIGCGMIAVRTQLRVEELPADRSAVRKSIERSVPLSAGHSNRKIRETAEPRVAELVDARRAGAASTRPATAGTGTCQLGSLGSGNHFIEVSADEQDRVWLFLHSGSRGVGNKIASHHVKVAQELAKRWWIPLADPDLAYLVEGTDEFWAYVRELRWAQHFALLNREEMMDRVVRCVADWTGEAVVEQERINCHHNFTEQERHFGRDGLGLPQGGHRGAAGPARPDPGLDGDGQLRRRGAREPGVAELVAARRGPDVLPVGGARSGSPTRSCGRRWSGSSSGTPRRSWTRSRGRTRTSTR